MRKRKIVTIGVVVVLLLAIISVPIFIEQTFASRTYNDDKALAEESEKHSTRGIRDNGNDFIDSPFNCEFEYLNGLMTKFIVDVSSDTEIDIAFSENITSGKFKVVVVSHDGTVKTLSDGENKIKCTEGGEYRIKMVGVRASGNYEISMKPNSDVSIIHG